jgi:hypothetical protein
LVSDIPAGDGKIASHFYSAFLLTACYRPLYLYFMLREVLDPSALAACIGRFYWPFLLDPFVLTACCRPTLIKIKYREIQSGAVAKSYMRKGFLIQYMRKCENISPYMRRPLVIYDFATAPL